MINWLLTMTDLDFDFDLLYSVFFSRLAYYEY